MKEHRMRATPALPQAWPAPSHPRPIVLIGAGAVARAAHLPAYRRASFPVAGVYDITASAAEEAAAAFGIPRVFRSLDEACGQPGVVFDVAVPGHATLGVLERLPRGAAVLMQKPMGENLSEARRIVACATERELIAAVNLQLRFSPGMLALRELIRREALGAIVDIDVRVTIDQPWQQWRFLERAARLELPYHSIHYLDAIRWIAGEPAGAYCRAVRHPGLPAFQDTRSTIILDYGDLLRCSLVLNHTHRAGPKHRSSQMVVEGTTGAARLTWGVNLAYPAGPPDTMELSEGETWRDVPLRGSWFPDAFEGPMSNLQRVLSGEDTTLVGAVSDALRTMALIDACYLSSDAGGMPAPAAG